jgi:hypothetical protein
MKPLILESIHVGFYLFAILATMALARWEAVTVYFKAKAHLTAKMHPYFNPVRWIVFITSFALITILYFFMDVSAFWQYTLLWDLPMLAIACLLQFSFFHDGVYFTHYNKLNPNKYPHKWKDYADSKESILDFKYDTRKMLFVFSIFAMIVLTTYKYWN